jgi:hypothetical protein
MCHGLNPTPCSHPLGCGGLQPHRSPSLSAVCSNTQVLLRGSPLPQLAEPCPVLPIPFIIRFKEGVLRKSTSLKRTRLPVLGYAHHLHTHVHHEAQCRWVTGEASGPNSLRVLLRSHSAWGGQILFCFEMGLAM